MADSQDAIDLKRRARRRLVGAIALIVFVVIALPIVLDREPKQVSQDLTIQIPSQDTGKFSGRLKPIQPDSVTKPATELPSAQVAERNSDAVVKPDIRPESKADNKANSDVKAEERTLEQASGNTASKLPAPAASVAKIDSSAQKLAGSTGAIGNNNTTGEVAGASDTKKGVNPALATDAKPAQAAADMQGFVVPLGVFTKADNIKQIRAKAAAAGFKTFTDPVTGTDRVRVRAGPFASRESADQARDKLKGAGLATGAVAAR